MTGISNFHLQLNNVTFAPTAATAFDLMIVESGYYSNAIDLTLSTADIAALQAQGRTVISYLNVAVTDHNRSYWTNDDWVAYTDPANRDVGEVNAAANPPDWLLNNHMLAGDFGYIVDYTDPVWRALVIEQAIHMVTPVAEGGLGYSGLFLDDVGRYFDAQDNDDSYDASRAADDMIAFVNEIGAAVRAITPDAYIAINGGAYIGTDSGFGLASAEYAAFLGHVDGFMLENQFDAVTGTSPAWVAAAERYAGPSKPDFLAVESRGDFNAAQTEAFYQYARDTGLLGLVTPDQAYDIIQALPPTGTALNDVLTGGDGPNIIEGLDGRDIIYGGAGDDLLSGGTGNDILVGGKGNDRLEGGGGPSNNLFGDGIEAYYLDGGGAEIFRLYQAVLDRAPDVAGHNAWTARLVLEGQAAVDIAQGFMGSPEFQARFGMVDDAGFVTLLYNNVLERAPDDAGLARWTGDLDAGASRADVVLGFANSAEFIQSTAAQARAFELANVTARWSDDVYRLYQATLDRVPDLTGFLNWTERLATGMSFEEVADMFVRSPEFTATYADLENAGFVELLYQNVLDRAGDATGLANWTGRLEDGMTRAQVVEGFSQSPEFKASTANLLTAWMRAQGVNDVLKDGLEASSHWNPVNLVGGILSDTFVFEVGAEDFFEVGIEFPFIGGSVNTVLDLEPWDYIDLTDFGFASVAQARADFRQEGDDMIFFNETNGTSTVIDFLDVDMNTVLSDAMILI